MQHWQQAGASPRVRIVIAERPPRAQSRVGDAVATDRPGILAALQRLGSEVDIDLAQDAAAALAQAPQADLLIVDARLGVDLSRILEALREGGPPVVVVTPVRDDEIALEAFRRGAAECVAAESDFEELLPVVALEQNRRYRAARERGLAERRICWLEHLNDAIVNEFPAALAVLDADLRVVFVNPAFARLWFLSADAVRGQPLREVLPPPLLESGEILAALGETRDDKSPAPRIVRAPLFDGTRRAFDLRTQRLDDEGRVLLVLSDVTERERLHRRLRDLQRYNANIIQNMNSALLVVDSAARITSANPLAGQMLGADPVGLRGRSLWEWLPEGTPQRELIARTLEEGHRFRSRESHIVRADGSSVPIGLSCSPLLGAVGRRHGAVVILQDLTEIKDLQSQVLQTEKMASIGQLAAGVAHEINNPMGFIHANLFQMAEYLGDLRRVWEQVEELRRTAEADDLSAARAAAHELARVSDAVDARFLLEDFGKAVRECQEGSERIRHIVQDLRDFAHRDAAHPVSADINQCLDSTANMVWSTVKHSVVLKKEYGELPELCCYPMQLKQVFMNLLVNAAQAIEEKHQGGRESGLIHLKTQRRGDAVVVSVHDTGVGIDAEHLDRIFDPFFTTKQVGAGMGLGLSTSYTIVQRHGGTIRVQSERGVGTTFEVVLPLALNAAGEASAL